jgi:hypothetical protein
VTRIPVALSKAFPWNLREVTEIFPTCIGRAV